jgi:hypothetical protein
MDFAQQKPLVRDKLQQLQFLQWNAPPELAKLITDYYSTLTAYLQRRERLGNDSNRGRAPDSARLATAEAVKQFDLLDVIRGDMSQFLKSVVTNAPTKNAAR